jgi:hypothetical protein
MRETGQIHILSADTSGFWAFLPLQLVGEHKMALSTRMNTDLSELDYPTPTVMTDRDLKKAEEDTVLRTHDRLFTAHVQLLSG